MTSLIIYTVLIPFALMGINEAIIKPLAIKATKGVLRQAINHTHVALDERLQLPGQWEQFIKDKVRYFDQIIFPEVYEVDQLSNAEKAEVIQIVTKQFDLDKFFTKIN